MIEVRTKKGNVQLEKGKMTVEGKLEIPETLLYLYDETTEENNATGTMEVTPKSELFLSALLYYLNWSLKLDFEVFEIKKQEEKETEGKT